MYVFVYLIDFTSDITHPEKESDKINILLGTLVNCSNATVDWTQ